MDKTKTLKVMLEMKHRVLVYMIGVALIFLLIKVALGQAFPLMVTEIITTLIITYTLFCAMMHKEKVMTDVIYERQMKCYDRGIIATLGVSYGLHFVVMLLNQVEVFGHQVSFLSTALLVGFVIISITLHPKGFYFHQKLMILDKKAYYQAVLYKLFIYWVILTVYVAAFYFITFQMPFYGHLTVPIIQSVYLGYLIFVIQYLIFAIYERNHYETKEAEKSSHERHYVSKSVMMLMMVSITYLIVYRVFGMGIYIRLLSPESLSDTTVNINQFMRLMSLDFKILSVIGLMIWFKETKKLHEHLPPWFDKLWIAILVYLVYHVTQWTSALIITILPDQTDLYLQTYLNIQEYLILGLDFIFVIILYLIYAYIVRNGYPNRWLFLAAILIPLLQALTFLLSHQALWSSGIKIVQAIMMMIYLVLLSPYTKDVTSHETIQAQ